MPPHHHHWRYLVQAHEVLPAALGDSVWVCAYPIVTGGACFTVGCYLAWAAAARTPWLPLHSALRDRDSLCKALYLVVGHAHIFSCCSHPWVTLSLRQGCLSVHQEPAPHLERAWKQLHVQGSALFLLGGLLLDVHWPVGELIAESWPHSLPYVIGCLCFLASSVMTLQDLQPAKLP